MSIQLTYYLRQGIITGGTSDKPIYIRVQRGNNNKHAIYDYPGEYAQRFDGVDKGKAGPTSSLSRNKSVSGNTREGGCSHFMPGGKFKIRQHRAASRFSGQYFISSATHTYKGMIYPWRKDVAFVDDGKEGFFIHGGPPCNGRRCIVVPHGLDDLLKMLSKEGGGIIHIRS